MAATQPRRSRRRRPEPKPPSPSSGVVALVLIALAWLHRLCFLASNEDRSWAFSLFYEGDAERFYDYARSILAGVAYNGGVPFHPPVFPHFLAGLHILVGAGDPAATVPHGAIRVILALVGSLPIGLLYLLARPYLGNGAALAGAGLSLYAFGLYVVAATPVSEGLYLNLLLLSLLVWSRGLSHPLAAPPDEKVENVPETRVKLPWGRTPGRAVGVALLLGVLLGLLMLTRAEAAGIAVLLWAVGVIGVLRGSRAQHPAKTGCRTRLIPWLVLPIGVALTLAPWTIRNAIRLAEVNEQLGPRLSQPLPTFVPVTLYGPLNLALANHAGADGTFSPRLLGNPTGARALRLTDPGHLHAVLHGHQDAWGFIREQPGAFAQLVLRRWSLTLDAFALGWTQWNLPAGLTGVRRPVDQFVPEHRAGKWVVAGLFVVGLVICLRGGSGPRRWAGIVLLLVGHTTVTTGLFFGYARFGTLLLPFVYTTVAALGSAIWQTARGRRNRWQEFGLSSRARRLLLGLALLLLAAEFLGTRAPRRYDTFGTPLPGSTRLNPDATITIRPAVTFRPAESDVSFSR